MPVPAVLDSDCRAVVVFLLEANITSVKVHDLLKTLLQIINILRLQIMQVNRLLNESISFNSISI